MSPCKENWRGEAKEKRPFGNGRVLALYKRVAALCERHAYVAVVEAVNHRNEESL